MPDRESPARRTQPPRRPPTLRDGSRVSRGTEPLRHICRSCEDLHLPPRSVVEITRASARDAMLEASVTASWPGPCSLPGSVPRCSPASRPAVVASGSRRSTLTPAPLRRTRQSGSTAISWSAPSAATVSRRWRSTSSTYRSAKQSGTPRSGSTSGRRSRSITGVRRPIDSRARQPGSASGRGRRRHGSPLSPTGTSVAVQRPQAEPYGARVLGQPRRRRVPPEPSFGRAGGGQPTPNPHAQRRRRGVPGSCRDARRARAMIPVSGGCNRGARTLWGTRAGQRPSTGSTAT
jgi:hypothetical protein